MSRQQRLTGHDLEPGDTVRHSLGTATFPAVNNKHVFACELVRSLCVSNFAVIRDGAVTFFVMLIMAVLVEDTALACSLSEDISRSLMVQCF
jgi:hypothetical protein